MGITPKVKMIDSQSIFVDAVTEKGEVSFAEYFKRLLDLLDEVVTKDNKRHSKHELKSGLKHKYYWLHKY